MHIWNLTQHPATPDQIAAGVVEPTAAERARIADLLTFDEAPTPRSVRIRAESLAQIAAAGSTLPYAMIGGAPWLMGPLEEALLALNISPLYAFSRRESVETVAADGSVIKTNVFRHAGFVEV